MMSQIQPTSKFGASYSGIFQNVHHGVSGPIRATSLSATNEPENFVSFYGADGQLTHSDQLKFDPTTGTLFAQKIGTGVLETTPTFVSLNDALIPANANLVIFTFPPESADVLFSIPTTGSATMITFLNRGQNVVKIDCGENGVIDAVGVAARYILLLPGQSGQFANVNGIWQGTQNGFLLAQGGGGGIGNASNTTGSELMNT